MLLMGDEVRRTQRGNNNAYCQDNEISWFDWRLLERHADVHRFVKRLVTFRRRRDVTTAGIPISLNDLLHQAHIEWHGVALGSPDWGDHSHPIAFTIRSFHARFQISRHVQRVLGATELCAAERARGRGCLAAVD